MPEAGQIQATLPVYVTKELKLTVDFKEAPGAQLADMIWAIKPESVVVSGDASVLNDMDSIVLDSFDLLSSDHGKHQPQLRLWCRTAARISVA